MGQDRRPIVIHEKELVRRQICCLEQEAGGRMVILRVRRNLWLLAVCCLLSLGLITFRREGRGGRSLLDLEGSQGKGSDLGGRSALVGSNALEGSQGKGSVEEGSDGEGSHGEGSRAVFGSDPGGGLRILSSTEDLATIQPLGCVTTEQIAGGQKTANTWPISIPIHG